ncbi:Topoisomerase 1-associated factor 1 [Coemansia sp. RSA 2049]|nr:Topoisomerase 1-associated factor 1 [Coemansia sp. RSA 2049]
MELSEDNDIGEAYTDERISEELERYRNIVLSACSSLGNLQPISVPDQKVRRIRNERTLRNVGGKQMEYVPSEDCLSSLKDIKRYIQMDEQGEGKLVLEWLGNWNILESDIIPIFIHNAKKLMAAAKSKNGDSEWDHDIALKTAMLCVELFVFTTWSMDSEPEDVKAKFIRILRSYKRAFANSEAVSSLLSVAVMFARKSANTEKEAMLIKGILYVFRNILAIPDPFVSPSSSGIAQIESHDMLISVLDKELAIDFFLTLASSASHNRYRDLRPTLLDIVYFIFYRVPASALFEQPKVWFKTNSNGTRHGRHNDFGGVYAVSTGEGTIMPVFSAKEVLEPFANLFKKRNKVRKPRGTEDGLVDQQWRTVTTACIPILRRIAATFIESCFNPFVGALFEDLKTAATVVNDIMPRLLYMSAYFVDISLANPEIELGCTCVLVQTHVFGQIMRNTSTYIELKRWADLEPAMYCIQQILFALGRMRDTKLDSLSEYVLSNLFYDGDALDLFVKLCRVYKPTRNTRAFLEQVAKLTESFLMTLKTYAQSKAGMLVKKRVKKRSSKKNDDPRDDSNADDKEHAAAESEEQGIASGAEDNDKTGSAVEASSEGDSSSEEQLVERAFDFGKYELAFAVSDVVKTYSHLLAPPSCIENVYPMLYRIAVTAQRPQLFFKKDIMLRLLILFDGRFSYPHRTETLDLASWIFRQYMTVITSPSLRNHYKAEELGNKLAIECMLTFLKGSRLGTSIEPVITRHIIDLLASEDQDGDHQEKESEAENSNSGNSKGKQVDVDIEQRGSSTSGTGPFAQPEGRVYDFDDINDFDFDDAFNT